MSRTIYYLPGHGGRLTTGLGVGLAARGLEVAGRETVGDFRRLRFSEQVSVITEDLQEYFWRPDSRVVANSYGAYLFLHAQASLPPYPGQLLILSPIVGDFASAINRTVFSPPYAARLQSLANAGAFPAPRNAHIHVGSDDWQSVPEHVKEFGRLTGIPVTVVEGAGHMLPREYVGRVLDEWLLL